MERVNQSLTPYSATTVHMCIHLFNTEAIVPSNGNSASSSHSYVAAMSSIIKSLH